MMIRLVCARWFVAAGIIATGFIPPGLVTARLIPARAAGIFLLLRRGRHMARRLDAAQRTVQFINLPFISEFLAFREFDQFQDLFQLIHGVLERFSDLSGV